MGRRFLWHPSPFYPFIPHTHSFAVTKTLMKVPTNPADAVLSNLADQLSEQGYAHWDDFLDGQEVAHLRKEVDRFFQEGAFKEAGIGQGQGFQQNKAVRSDHIYWLDHRNASDSFSFFFARLQNLIDYLNQSCYLGIRDMEMHLALYPVGAFYKRHLDVFKQSSGRILSVICYLNDHWQADEGGQLRIYFPPTDTDTEERYIDLLPQGGRLVFFLSDQLEHEVLPARRARYSITGWMKKEHFL